MNVYKATEAWKLLNGVFCIFKSHDMAMDVLKRRLRGYLCKDLNGLQVRPPGLIKRGIFYTPQGSQEESLAPLNSQPLFVTTQLDYSDHPLVIGERFAPEDIHLEPLHEMDYETSGICGEFNIASATDLICIRYNLFSLRFPVALQQTLCIDWLLPCRRPLAPPKFSVKCGEGS